MYVRSCHVYYKQSVKPSYEPAHAVIVLLTYRNFDSNPLSLAGDFAVATLIKENQTNILNKKEASKLDTRI